VYILDSDVLTIIDGTRRFASVTRWFNSIDETDIYLSVIAILEKSKNAAKISQGWKRPRGCQSKGNARHE
jgi:hypothetical protein